MTAPAHAVPARALPRGATDVHVHVFDPARHPYAADRAYTPGPAPVQALLARHAALGIERAVLVQPSVYGEDNSCLLEALAALGAGRARGVAVVDPARATRDELLALHDGGVRGIRLNLEVRHEADPQRARAQIEQAGARVDLPGWHLQVHASAALLPAVAQALPACRVPLVLDHFGGLKVHAPGFDESLATLLALLATGRVHVKLSAFYRASADAPGHAALAPLVRHFVRLHPDRLLWGSDWPHTGGGAARDPDRIEPFRAVDLPASLAALQDWAGDPAVLQRLLVDNPARLYGFTGP